MQLSVKSDYASRAVLGLARHYPDPEAVRVETLGREIGVPPNYLVQILIELKSGRIVKSFRGKQGGYLLARPPAEITLGDVLRGMHGQVFSTPALSGTQAPLELRNAWRRLQVALDTTADAITFQRLVDEANERQEMYYI